jgi:hypothetical protein
MNPIRRWRTTELAIETFFPADDLTAERMRSMAANLK